MGVGGARSHHPRVGGRQQANRGGDRRSKLRSSASSANRSMILAVDVDGDQAVGQIVEPAAERFATGAQSRTQVVLHRVGGSLGRRCGRKPRRPNGPRRRCLGSPAQRATRCGLLDSCFTVAGRPEAQVALPHQRLQQGVGVAVQPRCGIPKSAPAPHLHTQLVARQRLHGHGFPDGLTERRPVSRRQPVGLLPAGQLPLATRRTECQVGAAFLRRE